MTKEEANLIYCDPFEGFRDERIIEVTVQQTNITDNPSISVFVDIYVDVRGSGGEPSMWPLGKESVPQGWIPTK
jgi:hypothetical protein